MTDPIQIATAPKTVELQQQPVSYQEQPADPVAALTPAVVKAIEIAGPPGALVFITVGSLTLFAYVLLRMRK